MDSDRRERTIRAVIGLILPVMITGALIVVAPPGIYLWLKALHVAAAGTWVGGMMAILYLLSWHVGVLESGTAKVLSKVETQVLLGVVNPAMVVVWGIGLWLAWDAGWFMGGWLRVKLTVALALSALHGWIVRIVRAAAAGTLKQSETTFRNVNVVLAVVGLGMIILAVVKPM